MNRKTLAILPALLIAAAPLAASADTSDARELEMFRSATLTLQQAADAALRAHDGRLAEVSFTEEDGRGAYEALIVGSDGKPWTVLIDARTGEAFGAEQAADAADDEDNGACREDHD